MSDPPFALRPEQLAAFSAAAVERFVERMAAHLARFYPRESAALGPRRLREEIRSGIERAAAHGLTAERDVCRFLAVRLAFGPGFDRDPRLPWARKALADRRMSPAERALRLWELALANAADAPERPWAGGPG